MDLLAPVRWRQPLSDGELTFELGSSDGALLSRAALVFRYWRCDEPSAPAAPARGFYVEPQQAEPQQTDQEWVSRQWQVRSGSTAEVVLASTPEHALAHVEFASLRSLAECPRNAGVHGALLSKDGCGLLIVGHNEAGKSTLACALWQREWSLLCDDYVLLGEGGRALPTARRVSLRFSSRALLGNALWQRVRDSPSCHCTAKGLLFHPYEVDGRPKSTVTSLAAIIFLERRGSTVAPASACSLDPAHALLALLPYCNLLRVSDQSSALSRLAPLARVVPAFDLGRGPLPQMISSIEGMIKHVTQ